MKTIKTNVYTFDELDDKAKEEARDWCREHALDYEWWEYVYEDAKTIGLEITSFDLDRNRHAKGTFLYDSETVAENVIKNHGKKTETYQTAKNYLDALKKEKDEDKRGQALDEFEQSLLEDYSIMLQRESEHLVSNEVVDDTILANEYTFTKDGKRFG